MELKIARVQDERPPGRTMLVADALTWYDTSQATIYRLLAAGRLHRYRRSGDRRVYLSVDELESELRPRREDEKP